jgi:hypothetical protein
MPSAFCWATRTSCLLSRSEPSSRRFQPGGDIRPNSSPLWNSCTGYAAAQIGASVSPDASALPDTVCWLQKNYRFLIDSDIFNLSESIKQGDTASALTILRQPTAMGVRWIADDGWEFNRSTVLAADQGYAPYREALARYLDSHEANPTPSADPGP